MVDFSKALKNKKKTTSGAPGTAGTAEQWDKAAAKASEGAKEQKKIPLDHDEEQVRVELELPTPLATDALALSARQAAGAQKRIDGYNVEIAEHQTAINELAKQKKGEEKTRAKHLREIDTGAAWEMVECIEVHRYRTNQVSIFRIDPKTGERGEHVKDRPMSGAEREKATFDPPPADGPRIEVPAEDTPAPPRAGPAAGEPVH